MTSEAWTDTQKLLAFALVLSFVIIIVLLMFFPPKTDASSAPALYGLIGTLGGMAVTVSTYYFGSSKGSSNKDDTISGVVASQAKTIEDKRTDQQPAVVRAEGNPYVGQP